MKCPSCGRENGDENNFCFYCGYSFRERKASGNSSAGRNAFRFNPYENETGYNGNNGAAGPNDNGTTGFYNNGANANEGFNQRGNGAAAGRPNGTGQTMTVLQWTMYFLFTVFAYSYPLLMIVWIIITCRWAFGQNGSRERKNFAKGLVIAVAIVFVISFIYVIAMISMYGVDEAIYRVTDGLATSSDALMKMIYGNTK